MPLDKPTQKIYDAFRKGTKHLEGIPEDRHEHALINVKTTDMVAILDALDDALKAAPAVPGAPVAVK